MANYERMFRGDPAACGEPNPSVERFLRELPVPSTVLDLGCGQGRDALVAAHAGHVVTGVDLSPTGIRQMVAAAQRGGFEVTGVVSDLLEFQPVSQYHVVLLDRVLHQFFDPQERAHVLAMAAQATRPGGTLVIADVPSHRAEIDDLLERDPRQPWKVVHDGPDLWFATPAG